MALIGRAPRLVALLLLACLAASLLASRPARASQPPAAGLLATATGVVDRASEQITSAPADAAAQVAQTVAAPVTAAPQAVGTAVADTGAVTKAAQPVVSGAVRDAGTLAPVTHTLESAAGTVRGAVGVAGGASGVVGGTVGTVGKVVAPPPPAPAPEQPAPSVPPSNAEPGALSTQPAGAAPVTSAAAPVSRSAGLPAVAAPPAPRGGVAAFAGHTPIATPATVSRSLAPISVTSAFEVATIATSRSASSPDHDGGHGPLRAPVPGGTPGSSLSAPGGTSGFALILFGLLLAALPTLSRRLRPTAARPPGTRLVLILDRPG